MAMKQWVKKEKPSAVGFSDAWKNPRFNIAPCKTDRYRFLYQETLIIQVHDALLDKGPMSRCELSDYFGQGGPTKGAIAHTLTDLIERDLAESEIWVGPHGKQTVKWRAKPCVQITKSPSSSDS